MLNCNEMLFYYLKISIIKKRVPFWLKVITFVMVGICLYFLKKALGKKCSNQLQDYNPVNWKKIGRP